MDDTQGAGFASLGKTTDGTQLSWDLSGSLVVPGRSYYFKVAAENLIGQGSLSETSLKIIAATIPGTPDIPVLVS